MTELTNSELSLLNTLVYMEGSDTPNKKVAEIVDTLLKSDNIKASAMMTQDEARTFLQSMQRAIERNPALGEYRVYSDIDTSNGYGKADIVTFYNGSDAVTVFEGTTGQKEWQDNVLGGIDADGTESQDLVLDYINKLSEKFDNITVTGHSKGGNKAQYVTLNSENVDRCVSFDGQGFSDEFVNNPDNIAKILANRHKITSICADGDPVNALLNSIAGETIYISTDDVPEESFTSDDGIGRVFDYHKPNLLTNEYGELRETGQQKEIAQFFNKFSSYYMGINEKDRDILFAYVAELIGLGFSGKLDEVLNKVQSLDSSESILFVSYLLEFAEQENLQYGDLMRMFQEVGVDTSGMHEELISPIWYVAMNVSKDVSHTEFVALVQSLQSWAIGNGQNSWTEFAECVAEDPWQLLNWYGSLGSEKETIHKALKSFLTKENIEKLFSIPKNASESITTSEVEDSSVKVPTEKSIMTFDDSFKYILLISYVLEFAEDNLQYTEVVELLKVAGIDASILERKFAQPLWDILVDLSKSMTHEELMGLVVHIQSWAQKSGLESWGEVLSYIAESPLRLVELYVMLGPEKKTVNEAIRSAFSPGNIAALIAGIAKEYPLETATVITALNIPGVRSVVGTVAGLVISAGTVYLIADYIYENWDVIVETWNMAIDYVKEKITEFYTQLKREVEVKLNLWVSDVLAKAEEMITIASNVFDKIKEGAVATVKAIKSVSVEMMKNYFKATHPFLYMIASKIHKATQEPISINMGRLQDCVDRMNNLATRVIDLDNRLDGLYERLCWNNIEQGENVFTSLANLYNLFRADLCVDEGRKIRKKADALSELFEGYEDVESWVCTNIPQGI